MLTRRTEVGTQIVDECLLVNRRWISNEDTVGTEMARVLLAEVVVLDAGSLESRASEASVMLCKFATNPTRHRIRGRGRFEDKGPNSKADEAKLKNHKADEWQRSHKLVELHKEVVHSHGKGSCHIREQGHTDGNQWQKMTNALSTGMDKGIEDCHTLEQPLATEKGPNGTSRQSPGETTKEEGTEKKLVNWKSWRGWDWTVPGTGVGEGDPGQIGGG